MQRTAVITIKIDGPRYLVRWKRLPVIVACWRFGRALQLAVVIWRFVLRVRIG